MDPAQSGAGWQAALSSRAMVVCAAVALGALAATATATAANPRLTEAGIACSKGENKGETTCLLFIRADNAGAVSYKLGGAASKSRGSGRGSGNPGGGASGFHQTAYWGRGIYGAKRWYTNPLHGGACLKVQALAEGRHDHGRDRGKVKLCDVGWGPATSAFESAWSYAEYHPF
jgi:hypothetical protein